MTLVKIAQKVTLTDLIQRPVPNSTSQGIGGSVCSMCGVNSGEDLSVDDSEEVGDNGPATPGDNLHGEDATCTTSTQTPLLQYQVIFGTAILFVSRR